jgi:DNA-binding response OmpR family regulator
MLTSEAEWEDRGKMAGATSYLAKPIRGDSLLSIVAAHLKAMHDHQRAALKAELLAFA